MLIVLFPCTLCLLFGRFLQNVRQGKHYSGTISQYRFSLTLLQKHSHLEFEFRTALNIAKSQVFLGKRPSYKEAKSLNEPQFLSLSLFAP